MKHFRFTLVILMLAAACFGQTPPAPGGGSPQGTAAAPPAGGGAGGFSIEAEILAYKALESDSEAIACEVAWLLIASEGARLNNNDALKPPCRFSRPDGERGPGVLIVSSATTVLANYQIWRVNMVIVTELLAQAKGVCPPEPQPKTLAFLPDATSAITLIQSTLQLFASNESVTGVTGTIQDQALMNDVARQLRYLNFPVLMPDTYYPHNFGGIDYAKSPFLSKFKDLITERVRLGGCINTLVDRILKVTKVQDQLVKAQNDFDAADKAKQEAEIALKAAPDKEKEKARDVAAAKLSAAQINLDKAKRNAEPFGGSQSALDLAIKRTNIELNRVQSVVASIDGFVATVTGGTPPLPPSGPTQATGAAAPSPGTATPGATTPGTTQTPTTPPGGPAPASGSSTPPIVAILWADGLAREIGVNTDGAWNDTYEPKWSVLALKALESGGSLINEANIFGTRVRFSGGAVATYSLFGLDKGRLFCSGDFFDYGGYIRAKDFAKKFTDDIDPTRHLIYKRPGACPGAASH
jgi:hypothetical protein